MSLLLPALAAGAALSASLLLLVGLLTGRIRPGRGTVGCWLARAWAGPRRASVRLRQARQRRLILAAIAALAVTVISAMPVLGLLTGLAVAGLPWLLGGGRVELTAIVRLEAIESWTRRVKDLVDTGSGLQQAIVTSAATAPGEIGPQVRGMAMAVQAGQDLATALRAFAAELDDTHADEVVVALIQHSQVRGQRLGDILAGIADAASDQAATRRAVHAERAGARMTLNVLTGMVIAEFAFGLSSPAYSAPYATAVGQVVLAVCSAAFIALLLVARKMSLPPNLDRILAPELAAKQAVSA